MVGIDLFSGAGGMSLGAQMAGVEVRLSVEIDKFAARTYKTNHPNTDVFVGDITGFNYKRPKHFHKELIVFGGPPCQGFSTSNQRTRSAKNVGNWLWMEFLRVVKSAKPEWVVFENVKGILETENGHFVFCVQDALSELGYTSTYSILNAEHFGVPQKRQRFFLVATLGGVAPALPTLITSNKIIVYDAFADLPELENGAVKCSMPYRRGPQSDYAKSLRNSKPESSNHLVTRNAPHIIERYKHVPEGGNWANIPEELMGNYQDRTRCHTGIYHRLRNDEPSVVIGNYRKNMLIHPTENRGLSVREAARLQSFPDTYHFEGSIGFQQQQVGNAVPPLLAKAVFESIMRA